jgi:hypothetical protein
VRFLAVRIWASPATLLGLLFALPAILGRARVKRVNGVLEVCGGPAAVFLARCVPLPGGASAMTLGHVVLGRDEACLERTRPHERVHVRQYERWGPFFIPVYLGISAFLVLFGRDSYAENPFEREAREGDV